MLHCRKATGGQGVHREVESEGLEEKYPAGERKVHSLVDKVYKRKNLEVAWEKVKRNRGAGGVDGEDLAAFEASLDANLDRLHRELRDGKYVPQPVLRRLIPKAGQPGKFRPLGIPTIYDRVCQQALLNRLGPIFEPVFDDANYGYRQGRSTHGALRKIWRELDEGHEWVVDADLADFFGSVDHEKLLELTHLAQRWLDLHEEIKVHEQFGVGFDTAAEVLIAAGDNTDRIRSEAAFAKLCGVCPIPAGSGKTSGRHRLNRGGNRQANAALYRVVVVRLRWHPPTIAYVKRRKADGLSKKDIIRCLKRFVARELYHLLPEPSLPLEPTSTPSPT